MKRWLLLSNLLFAVLRSAAHPRSTSRRLENVYYETTDQSVLGAYNESAALGNPMKGIFGGQRWKSANRANDTYAIPSSLEWYNVGFGEVVVGPDQYDWALIDSFLEGAASRGKHVVMSTYIHWKNQTLELPYHLANSIGYFDMDYGERSHAIHKYIAALGNRYDGDRRLFVIHPGLLGFWGEFHSWPYHPNNIEREIDIHWVPEESKELVLEWYSEAFPTTKIQARYPRAGLKGMGFYDGAFARETLDGTANGGSMSDHTSWYFIRRMANQGQMDAWMEAPIGGETHPELQSLVFKDDYPAGTSGHQSFLLCVLATRASFILHHDAYSRVYSGTELERALVAHGTMGYNFQIEKVSLAVSTVDSSLVDLSVVLRNGGVAPFYYDLSLKLSCPGVTEPITKSGIERLLPGQRQGVLFESLPASCLSSVDFSLDSSYAYESRPIRFAQGKNGSLVLHLPQPPMTLPPQNDEPKPTKAPMKAPIELPTQYNTKVPTKAPIESPAPDITKAPAPALGATDWNPPEGDQESFWFSLPLVGSILRALMNFFDF